jgi:hypothetical protein
MTRKEATMIIMPFNSKEKRVKSLTRTPAGSKRIASQQRNNHLTRKITIWVTTC